MGDENDDYAHCFICGGETPPDVNLVLYSRKQKDEKLPYFPFLEFHDPAPNAEPMASDSSIQGCIVCFSYLKTQWNHFLRSKTQINKATSKLRLLLQYAFLLQCNYSLV